MRSPFGNGVPRRPLSTKRGDDVRAGDGRSEVRALLCVAGSLDVDKDDQKRYGDFVGRKLYDVLLIGQAVVRPTAAT